MTRKATLEALSFEEALTELETIVRSLETGKAPLEDSITSYERGMELKAHCETKLRAAKAKIEKITPGENGTITTQPFDET
ncbi:MAG: exodeoxyribonuclease VII small subunit [Alphaproteobacteria bacterium]